MTIKEYCISRSENLNNYNQVGFGWKTKYDLDQLQKNINFKNIYKEIPDVINRDIIINHINEKNYFLALIEIMLWGQIGARPNSNVSKKTEILEKVINYDISKIHEIFEIVIKGDEEEIKELYESLETGGKNKIPEVDVSYFTKILSFASQVSTNEFKLLIYDKWTKLIHVNLCVDENDLENLDNLFSKNEIQKLFSKEANEKKYSTKLIYPKKGKGYLSYLDYCNKMNNLANQLSKELNIKLSAFNLEAYLFGNDLRSNKNKQDNNPRFWIQQNFGTNYIIKNREMTPITFE